MNTNKRRWFRDGARFDYDDGADVLYVHLEGAPSSNHSEMRDDGIVIDYHDEKVVGVTILEASQQVSLEITDWESLSLSLSPKFAEIIQRSRERREREGAIPMDEVWRRLGDECK